jgi:hypothetical protein
LQQNLNNKKKASVLNIAPCSHPWLSWGQPHQDQSFCLGITLGQKFIEPKSSLSSWIGACLCQIGQAKHEEIRSYKPKQKINFIQVHVLQRHITGWPLELQIVRESKVTPSTN